MSRRLIPFFSMLNKSCAPVQTVTQTVGFGTNNQTNAPAYGLYDYSVWAGIYLPTEITAGSTTEKQITSIEFEVSSYTPGYTYDPILIYVAHCAESIFDSDPAVDGSDLTLTDETLVYNDAWTISSNGWQNFNFDNNFCYDGTSNLYVRVENRDGTWQSGYGNGEYAVTVDRAMRKYQDNSYPTGNGTRYSSRINTKFNY